MILYVVVFTDKTSFKGGDFYNTKWNEIPAKKIDRIIYSLPDGNAITLHGYEKYYHFIEATNDLNGQNAGHVCLQHACIMGKKGNKVTVYTIILRKHDIEETYKYGDIIRREYDIKDSRIQALNKKGWK